MNVVGVDCGAKNIKVLIMSDGDISAKSSMLSGFDQKAAAENVHTIGKRIF